MKKALDTLTRWASFNPRRRAPSPYGSVMERAIAWSLDLTILFYLLRDLFSRMAMQVFHHGDIETIDAVKRINANAMMTDAISAFQQLNPVILLGGRPFQLYVTELLAEFVVLGIIVVGTQWISDNTPGKWLLGLKIARRGSHASISRGRYLLRYLAYLPSVGFFMIGVVWAHFNKERRTWHDMIAGTVVLQTRQDGWYIDKMKQGFRWLGRKIRPPKADNDSNTSA